MFRPTQSRKSACLAARTQTLATTATHPGWRGGGGGVVQGTGRCAGIASRVGYYLWNFNFYQVPW